MKSKVKVSKRLTADVLKQQQIINLQNWRYLKWVNKDE